MSSSVAVSSTTQTDQSVVEERELIKKSEKVMQQASVVRAASFDYKKPSSLEDVRMKSKSLENGRNSADSSEKRQPTAAELRAIETEKKAAFRQARMKALEEDALKAQVVIAQVKALSSSSLEGSAMSDGSDKPAENSLFS
eukprot:gene11999-13237_t